MIFGASSRPELETEQLDLSGLPAASYYLDLEPSDFMEVVARRLCKDIEFLSGIEVVLVGTKKGCIVVDTRLMSPFDSKGADIRNEFSKNIDYAEIAKRYNVSSVWFRQFPGADRSSWVTFQ